MSISGGNETNRSGVSRNVSQWKRLFKIFFISTNKDRNTTCSRKKNKFSINSMGREISYQGMKETLAEKKRMIIVLIRKGKRSSFFSTSGIVL